MNPNFLSYNPVFPVVIFHQCIKTSCMLAHNPVFPIVVSTFCTADPNFLHAHTHLCISSCSFNIQHNASKQSVVILSAVKPMQPLLASFALGLKINGCFTQSWTSPELHSHQFLTCLHLNFAVRASNSGP